jgi:hypothetical protein
MNETNKSINQENVLFKGIALKRILKGIALFIHFKVFFFIGMMVSRRYLASFRPVQSYLIRKFSNKIPLFSPKLLSYLQEIKRCKYRKIS